jgi:hypothetical protein
MAGQVKGFRPAEMPRLISRLEIAGASFADQSAFLFNALNTPYHSAESGPRTANGR